MLELQQIDMATIERLPYALQYVAHNAAGLQAAYGLTGLRPLLINRETMHILSSAGDVQALKTLGVAKAQVLIGEWECGIEKIVSVVWNGGIDATLLSRPDDQALLETLLEIDFVNVPALGIDLDYLQDLLDAAAGNAKARAVRPKPPVVTDTWGIPKLDCDLQGTEIGTLFVKWGTLARTTRIPGATVHFYTDDAKFRALLDDPRSLEESGCASAIETNISTRSNTAPAIALYNTYRKRGAALHWQRAGIRVFVDLNVPKEFFQINFLGVPTGWRAFANRAYTDDLHHLDLAYQAAAAHVGSDDLLYVVYGGRDRVQALCKARGWHWLAEDSAVARGKRGTGV